MADPATPAHQDPGDEPGPAEIASRWHSRVVLKRDVFSTVERGRFTTPQGEVDAVLRRIDSVPWWSWPIARHLFGRERNALMRIGELGVAPPLLFAGRDFLVRGYIDGVALHVARPHGDRRYFLLAKAALRKLHRAGVCHNDLNKEQNWLRGPDGRAYMTDFQLAIWFSRRGRLFRIAAYEDLRHLLKQKRRYAPEALTAAERRVLARKSWLTNIWMGTGKRVYYWITRGLFQFVDREGGGLRLLHDAPAIATRLKTHPQVKDAAVIAFPDRRAGVGLYAFVEAPGASAQALSEFIGAGLHDTKAPELLQIVEALPRDAARSVRNEILQLIAMNQIDSIDPLLKTEAERNDVARIVAGRRNLQDRTAF
jgi:acyl-CoA synthetase (AMP-forming)/AMP-acid ligase II